MAIMKAKPIYRGYNTKTSRDKVREREDASRSPNGKKLILMLDLKISRFLNSGADDHTQNS